MIYMMISLDLFEMFKIVKFAPVGFKQGNQPVQDCVLCKGSLNKNCSKCEIAETKNVECSIVNENNLYYHDHCLKRLKQVNS